MAVQLPCIIVALVLKANIWNDRTWKRGSFCGIGFNTLEKRILTLFGSPEARLIAQG
jgi:hypothetical protein